MILPPKIAGANRRWRCQFRCRGSRRESAVAQLDVGIAMKREPKYASGKPIREGDVVRVGEWEGVVESILTKSSPGYMDYVGEGVMLTGPAFGRLHTKFDDEDLVLVRRKQE